MDVEAVSITTLELRQSIRRIRPRRKAHIGECGARPRSITANNHPVVRSINQILPVVRRQRVLVDLVDEMVDLYKGKGVTKIVGIESRGFVMSSAVATRLGAGIVLCRKPGKLPCETVQESYAKEYGVDTIEIHKDAINENDIVLLHDDLLATGGTMKAACDLVKKFHPKKVYCNFIIELHTEFPHSREQFDKDVEISSLLRF